MYLQLFGLREEPFGVTPDPRFLYLGPSHREALASLLHGIQTGRGFMALIAGPGMGKTTLLIDLLRQTHDYVRSVSLFQTQCTRLELLRYMLTDSGLTPMGDDVVSMHEQFNQMLISNDRAGKKFVVVIDEAQNLSDDVLESVRLLSDFETPQRKLLQIILSGQPQLGLTLSRPEQHQLCQRMSIICRLKSLTESEVREYIHTRLAIAGRTAPLFSEKAVEAIAWHSGGIPRIINNYCFNLLSLACAMRRNMVSEDLVDEVTLDLEVNPSITAAAPRTPPRPVASPQKLAERFRVLREYRVTEQTFENGHAHPASIGSDASVSVQMGASELATEPSVQNSTANAHAYEPQHSLSPTANAAQPRLTAIPKPIAPENRNSVATSRPKDTSRKSSAEGPLHVKQRGNEESERRQKSAIRLSNIVILAGCIGLVAAYFGIPRLRQPQLLERVGAGDSQTQHAALSPAESGATTHVDLSRSITADPATHDNSALPDNHTPRNRSAKGVETTSETQFISNGSMQVGKVDEMPAPRVAIDAGTAEGLVTWGKTDLPKFAGESSRATLVPGTLIRKVVPKYPATVPNWLAGEVELTATVNEEGEIADVTVDKGTGAFSHAAVAAVREWRYTPFTLNGKPVRATTHVVIKFKP